MNKERTAREWAPLKGATEIDTPFVSPHGVGGVYCLYNKISETVYIGSTSDFRYRRAQHVCTLRKGTHGNSHLQAAWNKYGEGAFEFAELEVVADKNDNIKREQCWLDSTITAKYNQRKIADSPLGVPCSDELREKRRISSTGRKHSEETKEKIRQAHLGKPKTPEHVEKMIASKTGKKMSAEARANISAGKKGILKSEEHKKKIGAAHKGKKRSPEARERMRQAQIKSHERRKAEKLAASS